MYLLWRLFIGVLEKTAIFFGSLVSFRVEMASSLLFSSSGRVGLADFRARVGSGFEVRAAGRAGSGRVGSGYLVTQQIFLQKNSWG